MSNWGRVHPLTVNFIMKRLIVVLFIFLFGCAVISNKPPAMPENPPAIQKNLPVISEEIIKDNYGLHPDNYQEIVRANMSEKLLDPSSAVYSKWEGPQKGYTGDSMIGYSFGYKVGVDINAKDGMGSYVGIKSHYFVIHNDTVIKHDVAGIKEPWTAVP